MPHLPENLPAEQTLFRITIEAVAEDRSEALRLATDIVCRAYDAVRETDTLPFSMSIGRATGNAELKANEFVRGSR